jgi:uncharacterized protein (TIGR02246 family)
MKRGSLQLIPTSRDWLAAVLVLLLMPLGLMGTARLALQKGKKKDQPREQSTSGSAETQVRLPDELAIDTAISEMLAAWQIGNVEMLHKYYADDVTVVSGAWELPLMGWANFLRAYQNQRQRMQGGRLDRSNTYINLRGNLAWAVYQWEFAAVVDGKPTSARGHTTLILEKRKDRWLIVHNHTSLVPEMKAPEATPPPGAPKPAASPPAADLGTRSG